MMSKQRIEEQIGSNIAWLEFLQVSSLHWKLTSQGKLRIDLSPFEKLTAANSLPVKGLLSTIYDCLMDTTFKPAVGLQKAWHKDFGKTLPKQAWEFLWNSSLHRSRNVNVSMLTYKISYRWHLTPLKLHKISPNISEKCWKDCSLVGNFLHCFWLYPRLGTFWSQVIAQIDIIAETHLPNDPILLILNVWQNFVLDPLRKELVELLLCVARFLIEQHWKSSKIPSLSKWY